MPVIAPQWYYQGQQGVEVNPRKTTVVRGRHMIAVMSPRCKVAGDLDDVQVFYLRDNGTLADRFVGIYNGETNCFELVEDGAGTPVEVCE